MSNEQQNYYAVIPSHILNAKDITSDEKLLYALITSLSNDKGYCYASNAYFSKRFGKTDRSIRNWLNSLVTRGYISSKLNYKEGSKQVESRHIKITSDFHRGMEENFRRPMEKNFLDSIKDNNNKDNNKRKIYKKKKFIKPSLEETKNYFLEKGYKSDPVEFFDYWDTTGWDGVNSWKRRAVTWEGNYKRWGKPENKKTSTMSIKEMGEGW